MYHDPDLHPAPAPLPAATHGMGISTLRVGLIGLGTVGLGTLELLARQAALVARRAGRPVAVTQVAVRNVARARSLVPAGVAVHADPLALATDPSVDVLVEVAGGTTGALQWVQAALAAGKPVVTANKALLAEHGPALAALARAHGTPLLCEAAVAGCIPVLKALAEGLAGNRILALQGIVNGTSNYILSRMQDAGLDFSAALAEAQALGYAEADPALDVGGGDAAHKLAVLASLAWGVPVPLAHIAVQGIAHLQAADAAAAALLGGRLRLLARAEPLGTLLCAHPQAEPDTPPEALRLSVQPVLVAQAEPLAAVHGVRNAVQITGDACGPVLLTGAGAGAGPTASAVVADLVDLARGHTARAHAWAASQQGQPAASAPLAAEPHLLRVPLDHADERAARSLLPAVLAALEAAGVPLLRLQRLAHGGRLHWLLRTRACSAAAVQAAAAQIATLPGVAGPCTALPVLGTLADLV
ncbi:homoserine dehydrogenase [Acidovorax lacteus]|uniref:Homoserine dehydrogenase n=1 Tax=Acidovorax lacteus TaxID=1924988 RepID=A0ABP8LIA5_9BURK